MNAIRELSIVEPWLWAGFLIAVGLLLVLDLFVFHRHSHVVKAKEALWISAFWIGISLAFNAWFGWVYGTELGVEFLTGYLIEKSLSIDNLFVILLIFSAFRVPSEYQHRVLFWGIFGAVVMRGTLIIVGGSLIREFDWIFYIFGAILLISAVKFLLQSDEEKDVTEHWTVRLLRKFIPITPTIQNERFTVVEDGVRKATPLLVALVVIEATDLVFAVDSIPAVFAVTQDTFIAFASNILAILGLRALFFVIADFVARLRYLKPGLAAVLGFVGAKMMLFQVFHIPSWVSLLVIIGILTTAGLSSWYVARVEDRGA